MSRISWVSCAKFEMLSIDRVSFISCLSKNKIYLQKKRVSAALGQKVKLVLFLKMLYFKIARNQVLFKDASLR